MTEVVGIRFKSRGKVYYFDPARNKVKTGDMVVVETTKGLELGECARGNYEVPDEQIVPPLRCVVRIATPEDLRNVESNKAREKEAFSICKERIAAHGLAMKLVDVEYNFEGNKILFFFTSDGRVDFRELVKDLAGIFRMRIELRQIGVRDEAKMLGGIGICGRPYCCSQFLEDFQPVSTKMAKTQSMSLNPAKISGSCGRLMCCLRYEQDAYVDLLKNVPKTGTYVETADGYGAVAQVNLLRQKVKVRLDNSTDAQQARTYDAEDIAVVPGGRPKPGETPPSVLKLKERPAPEPEEEELPENSWLLEGRPVSESRFSEHMAELEEKEGQDKKKRHNRRRSRGNSKPKTGGDKPQEAASQGGEGRPPKPRKQGQQQGKEPGKEQNSPQNQQRRNGGRPRPKQGGEEGKTPRPGGQNPPKQPRNENPQRSGSAHEGEGAAKRPNHRRRYGKPKPKPDNN